jgi:hypothetical protein
MAIKAINTPQKSALCMSGGAAMGSVSLSQSSIAGRVKREIELKHIHPGFAQQAEQAAFGV